MEKKTTIEEITSSDKVTIYSISFEMDGTTEFEKFVNEFSENSRLVKELYVVLAAIETILEKGSLERFFRPEGRMNDNVGALPIERSCLRLYCLRISDEILILGNGGVKNTATYQEDDRLRGCVMDLQRFDAILRKAIASGEVTIRGKALTGIADKVFRI